MKKSRLLGTLCAAVFSTISLSSYAALIDNGGGLIYDDVLDVTWSQPNIARNWNEANIWANGLTLGGVSGWRLPYISVAEGTGPFTGSPIDCSTATEEACRDNELGYMFYHNLSGTANSPLFPGLQSGDYWSGTGYGPVDAWFFRTSNGGQGIYPMAYDFYSWAVHDGDVAAVPLPASLWLFGSGLLGLIGMAKRKHRE